ncbi:putative flavin-binding monooxygenase [Tepidicaulis marinus]|uniref:Putative flavin-binding monooxygenase n=1 Tax=Tepidicaulis marinus TaxID=1333998 RepID=A0A081BA39_9HYPH|nr:NAD(P)/FAD-dependent oxidoreductase [Tepidicaulis marinus]GAK44907.1 putative flavin-binding monooxygenase [Tepidicaulis marinus]
MAMTDAREKQRSVAIIGAGMSGICTAIKLKEAGITDFTIYEKASEIGGTWRENTYPGCSCDVPLHMYQFSFDMRPDWERKFVFSADIKAYLESVVDKYGLRNHIRFNSEIQSCRFDERSGRWHIGCADGSAHEADVVAAGTGQLHRPRWPGIKGEGSFEGAHWHSAEWNHEYDLKGKRVAVIGNGASAIQFVPEVAKEAREVTVFQRSASWVLPRPQREFYGWERALYKAFPWLINVQRWKIYWFGELLFRAFHTSGDKIKDMAIEEMELYVSDPEKKAKLTPDYEPGCKRVLFANDWWPAMGKDHVHVVTEGIEEICPSGIKTKDGALHEVDAIIYGTGFDTTNFLGPMEVTGLAGRELKKEWKDGAEAHYGMTVTGFPNFFLLYGPNTNLGHNSIIFMIECQANYIRQCVEKLREDDLLYMDVKPKAQALWNEKVQSDNANSVFASGCTSWYKTDAGKVTNNWANYTFKYWWWTRRPDFAEFTLRERPGKNEGDREPAGAPVAAQ